MNFFLGWKGYAAVAVAAGLFAGWAAWQWQANAYERKIASMESVWAKVDKARTEAYAKAVSDQHDETKRRVKEQTEIANDAFKQAESARADARASESAHRELLARATALANASRRPGDPATVSRGTATADPIGMLANVLGRCSERASILGRYADAARIAGQACERSYDSLSEISSH